MFSKPMLARSQVVVASSDEGKERSMEMTNRVKADVEDIYTNDKYGGEKASVSVKWALIQDNEKRPEEQAYQAVDGSAAGSSTNEI